MRYMRACAHFGLAIFMLLLTGCSSQPRKVLAFDSCYTLLHQIQGAKDTWALEHKKRTGDVPTDADLFGPDGYIREKPKCPQGGSYTLRAVGELVTCSIPGHTQ